jgi:hypothetical protein
LATSIVEIAAWFIVGKGLYDFFGIHVTKWQEDRRKQLESAAAELEYYDAKTTDQRRHDLELRYPERLISGPQSHFFEKALANRMKVGKRRRSEWSDSASLNIQVWLGIGYAVLTCWIVFKLKTGQFTFELFMATPLGAGILTFTDLLISYTLLRRWAQRSRLGKLAAVSFSISAFFAVLAFIEVLKGTSYNTANGEGAAAGFLAACGIGAWLYSKSDRET